MTAAAKTHVFRKCPLGKTMSFMSVSEKHMRMTELPRRQFLQLSAGVAALASLPHQAFAQAYPARPVRVIVAFAPSGTVDIFARLATQKLSETLGKQFYVENIPGASGNIGTGQ